MTDNSLLQHTSIDLLDEVTAKRPTVLGRKAITPPTAYNLTIVIPTRNERDNISPLLYELRDALRGVHVEIIFVDDSDDATPHVIENESLRVNSSMFHARVEHRPKGPMRVGGLATAVDLGISLAQASYVAVIDADLQHPPAQLRVLYDKAVTQNVDLVLATRYIKGGSYEGLDGISRRLISIGFKWAAKLLFPEHLLGVSDPLGGFFLFRRSITSGVILRPIGYKILLEILVRGRWNTLVEVPYHFQARTNGTSKADTKQGIWALQHMGRLFVEVPDASRVWKLGALVLVNILVVVLLVTLSMNFLNAWSTLRIALFAIIGAINFLALNRVIFPYIRVSALTQPIELSATSPSQSQPIQQWNVTHTNIPRKVALIATTPTAVVGSNSMLDNITSTVDTMPLLPTTPQPENISFHDMETTQMYVSDSKLAHSHTSMNVLPATPRPENISICDVETARIPNTILKSRTSNGTSISKVLSRIPLFIVLIAVGWIIFTLPGAWVIVATLFIGLGILICSNMSKQDIVTMILGIAVGLSIIDYLTWRFEVANWAGWWIAIPLLAAETLGAIHTLGFQYTLWPRQQTKVQITEDATRHPIFIFVPTVDEGRTILEPTLRAIIEARKNYLKEHPHGKVNIVVCNDGFVANADFWQDTEILAKELGVQCVTRTQKGGAKAGNIEQARQLLGATGDALLVIFDADQIAKPDFLLKTIPSFGDTTVGWVQTGQYYYNLDNPVSRWADDQQAMFYNLLCPGKASINSAFICGTNVVIRARALDQIGGFPQDSITEDFSASIELHSHWRSLFLTDVLATGLGPLDMVSYLKQQRRWAIGTLSVIRSHWRAILPGKKGLSFEQRIQYFLACTHYLCGLRDLIYLLCPILFILTGVPAVKGSTLQSFLWHFLPYFLTSTAALWYAGRGITGLRGIIIGFGCFPVLLESLLSVILNRKIGFTVTSKKRGSGRSMNHLLIYIFFILLSIIAIIVATQVKGRQVTSMFISVMWIIYSLFMLGSFLWLNRKDMRARDEAKPSGKVATIISTEYPSRLANRERGLRPVWNLVLAFCLAGLIFTGIGIPMQSAPPTHFVLNAQTAAKPYLGLSLPLALLENRPTALAQDLHTHFSIVGRTQDVHDLFDRVWIDQLMQQHARPWITLEFGTFTATGKPPADASLTAIINGVHDDDLKRWAHDIRSYGKPVYLTVLLHVDRNWSLSSAVANGGIPQDAPKAWMHIQSVFKNVGATNVAWVWSPADPAHDQEYAPPLSTIDCVLLSLISYPHTQWADPVSAIRNVSNRYPTKPIILEVSANGSAKQKASWLMHVGSAVMVAPHVYALIYHEGSPNIKATAIQNNQWSLLSDQDSLNAMRHIASTTQSLH